MDESSKVPTVLVTGFGPFRNHTRNSSWLTVQELVKIPITGYRIIAKELPVEYDTVSKEVPHLWKEYNPKLVVHCGMSEQAKCLVLETKAHNKNYLCGDIKGELPAQNCSCSDGPEILSTSIDVDKVVCDIDSTNVCVKAQKSEDAGMYLCEFIFYTSLRINRNTAFVHIPPVDEPYSVKDMAKTLEVIIRSMLKQVL
ncbi:pyroglutamyl-peptidase 1-like [Uloborus diversus]|uniref:pyroglutamyl-peptidase 1-like n=1 Tax=Uloborus diversus TaxID=327109 RepID=UPI0024090362|nr:pyroglutamyl-peptidase 1-like [Uloborus diversus]